MQIVGTIAIVMMAAFWSGHTTKAFQPGPPAPCQLFDTRYETQYKPMCDAWFAAHP